MRNGIVAAIIVVLLTLIAVPAAFADGGPHGGYTSTGGAGGALPDQCAACHRVHQGQSSGKLLKADSPYALCLTCHNGAGSRLDVMDGVKLTSQLTESTSVIRTASTSSGAIIVSVAPTALMNSPLKTGVDGAQAADGAVQTDETTAANEATAGDVTLLPAAPAVSDAYYVGGARQFSSAQFNISTAGAGVWTVTWEYWNGTAWTALTGVVDGTTGFTVAGTNEVSFQVPTDWEYADVNSRQLYWIRGNVSAFTSATTQPLGTQIWIGGFPVDFTIAVRNTTASLANVTLAVNLDGNLTNFNASTLADTALAVPAAVGGVPGVQYTTLVTRSKASAVATDSNVTTVRVTFSALNADVKVETRVNDQTAGNVLNGGGFRYIAGVPVTSRHNADPADNSLYPWGYSTANTGQNTAAIASPLQCTSCHNPHGTANYRLLKETINTATVVVRAYYSAAFTKDEGGAGIVSVPADKYTQNYYGSAGSGGAPITAGQGSLSSLCGACHTAYPSSGASLASTTGGVTHYRHKTEMPFTDWGNPENLLDSINPETGYTGTHTGANSTTVLIATGSLFQTGLEIKAGDVITNVTDGATSTVVTVDSETQITGTTLTSGQWDATDVYRINFGAGNGGTFPILRLASSGSESNTIVTCLTCHRVHGSTSEMSGYALTKQFGGLGDNDLTPSQLAESTSTLLYTDNRGMCQACHQW